MKSVSEIGTVFIALVGFFSGRIKKKCVESHNEIISRSRLLLQSEEAMGDLRSHSQGGN